MLIIKIALLSMMVLFAIVSLTLLECLRDNKSPSKVTIVGALVLMAESVTTLIYIISVIGLKNLFELLN